MEYETVARVTQVASLLMFIAMFIAVLVYALRPKNKATFDKASRAALNPDRAPSKDSSQVEP